MSSKIQEYLYYKVLFIASEPFIPDYVIAFALQADLDACHKITKHYQKISRRNKIFTRPLRQKLFLDLVATCVTDADDLFYGYKPVLCSPLIFLLTANKLKTEVTKTLVAFLKSKKHKKSLVHLYDEALVDELLCHPDFQIRYVAQLLKSCMRKYKTLPKEQLLFEV
jgi:hypothetical protein